MPISYIIGTLIASATNVDEINDPVAAGRSTCLLRRECNLLTAVKGFKVDLEASRT